MVTHCGFAQPAFGISVTESLPLFANQILLDGSTATALGELSPIAPNGPLTAAIETVGPLRVAFNSIAELLSWLASQTLLFALTASAATPFT